MNLVLLTSWKMLGPLAFSFISIYAAGLNAGSPESVHKNFLAFVLAMGWAALISMLPIWKGTPPSPTKAQEPRLADQLEIGFRLGIGASIAELISFLLGFAKMGWATSGVGNVVRFDKTLTKTRAALRMVGTIGGVLILMISLHFTQSVVVLSCLALTYAFINGLTKGTKLGMTVTMYTATILTLYVLNDISSARELSLQRVAYNLIGVLIGVLVVMYPFPRLFKRIQKITASTGADVQS
jgi:hypothetical protein